MSWLRRTAIAVLSGVALMALPASAPAETVTIGNPLDHTHNFSLGACAVSCTALQKTQETDATMLPLTSPVNGVVTGWSVRSGLIGDTYRLRILRPAGGLTYAFAGSSPVSPAVPDVTDTIRNYTASVPIQQGDAIGLESVSGTGVPLHTGGPATPADTIAYYPAAANDGSSFLFDDTNGGIKEVLLRATVSFCTVPDVKGLKAAAARDAFTAAGCTATVKKKKLKFSKKNRKKKGKVLKQGAPGGSTAAPGTPVELTVAKLRPKPKKS